MTIGAMLESWRPARLLDFDVDVPARTDESDPAELATGAALAATGNAARAKADAAKVSFLIIGHAQYQPVRLPGPNVYDRQGFL